MRLFAAIVCPPTVGETLRLAQAELRRLGQGGSFPPPENLHLTLSFLGETQRLDDARAAVAACGGFGGFSIMLSGFGRFGDLWWAGVRPSPRLDGLERRLRNALRDRGFSPEERPFIPHVTLARRLTLPPDAEPADFSAAAPVSAVTLLESHLGDGPPRYTPICKQSL